MLSSVGFYPEILLAVFLGFLFIAWTLRLAFQAGLNFPVYPGFSPLQGTDTEDLMDEDRFWALIQKARKRSGNSYERQTEILVELLKGERPEEIVKFQKAFVALLNRTNHFRLWGRIYALNWGCSDDTFHYFRTWWIAQGKNKFYWTFHHPRLLYFVAIRDFLEAYEGIEYAADTAYKDLTGKELPPDDLVIGDTRGEPFSEGTVFLKYPELAFLAW